MRRRGLVILLAAALLAGCGPAPPPSARPVAVTSAPAVLPATPTPDVPWPATGALFGGPPADPGEHYCTASVIDAPGGDVVVTAAHCVASGDGTPPRTGMSFVPGYHDGIAPFGTWSVTRAVVEPSFRATADPDHDVAFLTVERAGAPPVEQVVGGYRLVVDPGPVQRVDAIGYPDFADAPQVRSGTTSAHSPTQLELDAHGLYDGTSGGPWLRSDPAGGHDVIGVTGGYEQGGLDPDHSYASYLDASVRALLGTLGG